MLSPRNSWKRAKVQGKVKLAICTWLGPGTPSLLLLPWPSQSQAKPRLQGLENWLMARNWGHNGKKAKWNMADSRAVQWWRLCASNLGDMASIPGQGTKIPQAMQLSQIITLNKQTSLKKILTKDGWLNKCIYCPIKIEIRFFFKWSYLFFNTIFNFFI